MSVQDFVRPKGIDSGVLLNTNNDALAVYKRTKKRMGKVDILEEQVKDLQLTLKYLQEKIDAISNR